MSESLWRNHQVGELVQTMLEAIPTDHGQHQFWTAYQIAVEFYRQYPMIADEINQDPGGRGTGKYNSLAQYLARHLSGHINELNIEMAFLNSHHINELSFRLDGATEIAASTLKDGDNTSMFRYKKRKEREV
ncbi:MAG: hypothetical protein SGI73_13200 [Chloroflexota bacterium]|nr:hypothetical protein [Chloroflexota bacterium]